MSGVLVSMAWTTAASVTTTARAAALHCHEGDERLPRARVVTALDGLAARHA
jgi:hypothetical protein